MSALFSIADRLPLVRDTTAVRWLTIALVVSIFLGNVHFIISFPVAIIPAIFLLAAGSPSIPVGACILGALMLPLLGQSLSTPLQDRTDLVLYLPFLYAVICTSAARPPARDRDLFAALMTGGIALSAMKRAIDVFCVVIFSVTILLPLMMAFLIARYVRAAGRLLRPASVRDSRA